MDSYKLYTSKDNIDEKRSIFFKKNIKSSYSKSNIERIIFYPKFKGYKLDLSDSVVRECNGYIFDIKKNKPLVIPTNVLSNNINYNFIEENINLYDIYKVYDGTIINLYWWDVEDSWKISTVKGYDVTNLVWNSITYENAFHSILEDIYNLTPDDFYSKLNKECSYTWGFNHPKFHPFWTSKNISKGYIWFVQSCDISDYKNENLKFSYTSPINCIQEQEKINCIIENSESKIENPKLNVNTMKISCDKALKDYEKTYLNKNPSILFGYILRSKNKEITKENSNLIIESSLLRKIRKIFYDKNFKFYIKIDNYNRENYILLYNYIDFSDNRTFLLLFPQYKRNFELFDNIVNKLVTNIIRTYQNTISYSNINYDQYQNIIHQIINYVDMRLTFNSDNKDHEKFIKQVIRSPTMIDKLYILCFP